MSLDFFCFIWARVFCIFYIFQYKFCLNYLQSTIGEISSISDKSVVSNLFGKTMRKLLKLTQQAAKVEPKVSNSMQIDDSTNANSSSFMRYASFKLLEDFFFGGRGLGLLILQAQWIEVLLPLSA